MSLNLTNFVRTGPLLLNLPRYFIYTTDDTWFDIDETAPPGYFSGAIELVRQGDTIKIVADDATKLVMVISAGGSQVNIAPIETL